MAQEITSRTEQHCILVSVNHGEGPGLPHLCLEESEIKRKKIKPGLMVSCGFRDLLRTKTLPD